MSDLPPLTGGDDIGDHLDKSARSHRELRRNMIDRVMPPLFRRGNTLMLKMPKAGGQPPGTKHFSFQKWIDCTNTGGPDESGKILVDTDHDWRGRERRGRKGRDAIRRTRESHA